MRSPPPSRRWASPSAPAFASTRSTTPTSPSIAAGCSIDPALVDWLKRARACPEASGLVLRGSLLLSALCPGGRAPVDVDYVVMGPFDAAGTEKLVRTIAAPQEVESLVIYGETRFPGLRMQVGSVQIDFGFNDPMPEPPRPVTVGGVEVLGCTAATLFGWKVHGLVEHGRGRWRAKDLFDLWWMWTQLRFDHSLLKTSVQMAFESRGQRLEILDDFLHRPDWGESRGGRRKWRVLKMPQPLDFMEARRTVRHALDTILR